MNDPQYLLRPVNPYFICFSLFISLLFNLLPWGNSPLVPDLLALVLVFWNIHQPRKVGIGIAFGLGLLMDVHDATLLGEHALAYSLLSYFAITIHRRVLWLNQAGQALHILPLLLMAKLVPLAIRLLMEAHYPGLQYFLPSVVETLLWPVVGWLLLLPQRHPEDVDETRPL